MEEINSHGGKRQGAGRKTKAEEKKAKKLILRALKGIYNKEGDDDNTIEFLKDFAKESRGKQFIAEHLLGKPKEVVENTLIVDNIKPIEWVD